MNEVSKHCTENDHHPEWSLEGTTLKVRLTSHFRDNTVSLMDFQLAKELTAQYANTEKARPYAKFHTRHWVQIGVFSFGLILLYFYKYLGQKFNPVSGDFPSTDTIHTAMADFTKADFSTEESQRMAYLNFRETAYGEVNPLKIKAEEKGKGKKRKSKSKE